MRMADISDSKIRESEGEHSPYPTAKRKRTIFLSLRWNYFLPQSLLCWLASWGCTMKDITGRKVSPFPQFLCPPPLPQQAVQPQNFHWDDGSCFMVFCTIFWVCSWFVSPPPPSKINLSRDNQEKISWYSQHQAEKTASTSHHNCLFLHALSSSNPNGIVIFPPLP